MASSNAPNPLSEFAMKDDMWSDHAAEYAKMMSEGPQILPIQKMLSELNSALPFSKSIGVLEVGSGPGPATLELFNVYGNVIPKTAKLLSTDFSEGMVKQVGERQKSEITKGNGSKGWDRLETKVVDAQNLHAAGLQDGSFSHVFGSLVYFMLPDPVAGLKEARRVLKDGGVVGLTSWSEVYWIDLMVEACQSVRSEAKAVFKMPEAWGTTEGVRKQLEEAGFKDLKVEYQEAFMTLKDKGFGAFFIKGKNPASQMMMPDWSDEEKDRVAEKWLQLVEEKCEGDPKRIRGVAIVAVGTK